MKVRRVVTGVDEGGGSCIRWDGPPPVVQEVESVPGLATYFLWSADALPTVPHTGEDPTVGAINYFPAAGGVRFILVTHPPGSGVTVGTSLNDLHSDDDADGGVTVELKADEGVMHQTDTIDLGVVVSGSISMGLDDGSEVLLTAGDTIVQTGVRHGWYNRTDQPCVIAFVIVGAVPTPAG
jgi:quercetin dioxygenase-like cupin family protein